MPSHGARGLEGRTVAKEPDWAYQSVTIEVTADDDDIEDELDRFGKEGWFLVATVPLAEDGTTYGVRYIFARPRS